MPAYVISEVEVRDQAAMQAYRTLAAQTIARYGGRYLARGGATGWWRAARRPRPSSLWSFLRWLARANGTHRLNMPRP